MARDRRDQPHRHLEHDLGDHPAPHRGRLGELIAADPPLGPIFANALPTQWVEPDDVSHAVIYLASDESRFVTGTDLRVDAGNTAR